jgi:hypothetical protein
MKLLIASLTSLAFSSPALATTYKGKCAKAAESAAVTFWANVLSPDANLMYSTLSSHASAPRSEEYTVVLAFSDGNESAYGQYKVVFQSLSDCSGAQVARSN